MSQVLSEFGKLIGTSANNIQVTVMPQASTVDVGTIVQYIGATNANYTNGYFYKCVSDGAVSPTYSWEQVDVQPASDAGATFVITISGDGDTTPYTADKTPAEVEAAYSAGKVLFARIPYGDDVFVEIPLLIRGESDGGIFFEFELCLLNPEAGDDILGGNVYGVQLVYATGGSSWAIVQGGEKDSKFTNQFTSMPVASDDYLDKVIQYIGATLSPYTNGYFYKCVSNGSGGYEWQQLNVQPANNTSATFDITLSGDGDITPYSVDKTPDEVSAAVTAGQVVRMITSEGYLDLVQASSGSYSFTITTIGGGDTNYAKTSYVLLAGSGSAWTTIYAGYGSAKATFDITLTGDGDTTPYSVDKTPAEVYAAIAAGKVVRLNVMTEGLMSYLGSDNTQVVFGLTSVDAVSGRAGSHYVILMKSNDSTWGTIIANDALTTDVTGKADKVSSATSGNFAALDANGNITDSGHKHSDYLTSHQDISGKADKPTTATTGNFASFDANKNPVDSGKKASDFLSGTVGVANGGTGQTTLTANAVLTGNGTTAIKQVATASGALYATAANGAPTFGTLPAAQGGTGNTSLQATRNAMGLGNTTGALPVANGGTGATTFTSGAALVGAGTGAVTTRAITNNTAKTTAPAGSTNLATMNSLLYGMQNYNNRASAVNAADTNYTTAMARAIYATTTDLTAGTTALTNGTIALVYE